jgi:DNA-binding response OmpR family regulator
MTTRILLVEDDPVSGAFLGAAARALPAIVDVADTCAAALDWAMQGAYDLWLIDANLPDDSGAALLSRLHAHFPATRALAHTASEHPEDHAALLAAGFIEVLVKPIAMLDLQTAICRALGFDRAIPDGDAGLCANLPHWDEGAALAALKGEQAHVLALRELFLAELAQQRDSVLAAIRDGDPQLARRTLHMLRASCGFVGAARLADAVLALESEPQSTPALNRFQAAVDALLGQSRVAAAAARA